MTDLIFLKALRDKLKGGNTRSIHLNVLPGRYATRLDLGNLNYIRPDFAVSWHNKGGVLLKLGKKKEAEKCYEKAKKLRQ